MSKRSTHSLDNASCSTRGPLVAVYRDEDGSVTIFTILFMVLMVMIGGIAVDAMRFERDRVHMQNTLDSSVLAAAGLRQTQDPVQVVESYFEKAGLDPSTVEVDPTSIRLAGGELLSREVKADSTVQTQTQFMRMMGYPELSAGIGATAIEQIENVEISLVLDVSLSMSWYERIDALEEAATEFVDIVIDEEREAGLTSISVVPYNHVVKLDADFLAELNADAVQVPVDNPRPYTGALQNFPSQNSISRCMRFRDDEFNTRAISPTTPLERVAHFDNEGGYVLDDMAEHYCDENNAEVLVHETNPGIINTFIEGLVPNGYTAIDAGVKWGVALLDPAIRPVVNNLVDDEVLSDDVENRPGDYVGARTIKVLVVMTDGENTSQRDLDDQFKAGPSRVWYNPNLTSGYSNYLGRNFQWYDGFFVEMLDNSANARWYHPGDPYNSNDDFYISDSFFRANVENATVQLDYTTLHESFSSDFIAEFFFENSDEDAYDEHMDAIVVHDEYATADDRLEDICDAAKEDDNIVIFSVAFDAPDAGETAMRNCASGPGFYFAAENKAELNAAFAAIAGQISVLRLTN